MSSALAADRRRSGTPTSRVPVLIHPCHRCLRQIPPGLAQAPPKLIRLDPTPQIRGTKRCGTFAYGVFEHHGFHKRSDTEESLDVQRLDHGSNGREGSIMSGPTTPRWTHIALPSSNLDASISWYEQFTPLRLLDHRHDADGQSAWLAHPNQVENPFVLVLVMFYRNQGTPQPIMGPFAHIGIELPTRADVDALSELGQQAGCLSWPAQDMPPPIGYICALTDPDGNMIEMSHNQGVYDAVQRVWGERTTE